MRIGFDILFGVVLGATLALAGVEFLSWGWIAIFTVVAMGEIASGWIGFEDRK